MNRECVVDGEVVGKGDQTFVNRVAIIDYHVEERDSGATLYNTLQSFRFAR